jgi:hypothetical protein
MNRLGSTLIDHDHSRGPPTVRFRASTDPLVSTALAALGSSFCIPVGTGTFYLSRLSLHMLCFNGTFYIAFAHFETSRISLIMPSADCDFSARTFAA